MIDLIQEIFGTIKRNKLRTFLTGFAVAWGIFMLIVLLGAGNGLIHAFESSSADMAMNSIKVFPGWTSKAYDGLKEGRRIELDNKDYRITETDFPQNVISVGATVRQSNVTLTYGQDYVSTTLEGVYPNHKDVERVKPAGGRFIKDIDIRQRRKVIWMWNRFTQFLQQEKGMRILTIAIWVIGIFTLLSGIVGVSNIMLITVKERTREFGIRKALGVKPISILWLIIAESVTITTFFGYIGMVAGIAATEYMNTVAGNQTVDAGVFTETVFLNPTVDISIAIQATMTLVIAGTLAGFFPARKAVMIRPIEALRAD